MYDKGEMEALDLWLDATTEREILENPNLLDVLIKQISKKVVGEEDTIKTILLSCFGSKVDNHKTASYNLLVNSESGSGKDYVVYNTIRILPKDTWLKRTRITPNVFTYWHNPKFEPGWSWDGKICYLEDIADTVLNSEVFKTMCSSGSNATVLIKQVPVDIEIPGKPVMIITSANACPNPELTRRFTIVNLDESIDQTSAIIERQARNETDCIDDDYNNRLTEALSMLKTVKVHITYAVKLPKFFPKNSMIMRTHFERFLDYIKSSCVLYQFQREQDENGYYLADGKDYDYARDVLLKMTSNPLMIPLTHNDRKVLELFEKLGKTMSIKEFEAEENIVSLPQLYRIFDKLSRYGFLEKSARIDDVDSRKNATVYTLAKTVKVEPMKIPTWLELKELLNNENDDNNDKDENDDND